MKHPRRPAAAPPVNDYVTPEEDVEEQMQELSELQKWQRKFLAQERMWRPHVTPFYFSYFTLLRRNSEEGGNDGSDGPNTMLLGGGGCGADVESSYGGGADATESTMSVVLPELEETMRNFSGVRIRDTSRYKNYNQKKTTNNNAVMRFLEHL